MVGHLIWQDSIEIFYSYKRLSLRLRNPSGNEDIALLLASTRDDLNEFVACGHLLSNLRLILILPDGKKETIAQGHLLRPRFISYGDSDFSDVALVLQKMNKTAFSSSSSSLKEVLLGS